MAVEDAPQVFSLGSGCLLQGWAFIALDSLLVHLFPSGHGVIVFLCAQS